MPIILLISEIDSSKMSIRTEETGTFLCSIDVILLLYIVVTVCKLSGIILNKKQPGA